jgi:hypothetical protein
VKLVENGFINEVQIIKVGSGCGSLNSGFGKRIRIPNIRSHLVDKSKREGGKIERRYK